AESSSWVILPVRQECDYFPGTGGRSTSKKRARPRTQARSGSGGRGVVSLAPVGPGFAVWSASGNSALAPEEREPRLRPALGEREIRNLRVPLDPAGLDGLDLPAIGERVVQFLARHPPRPLRPRLRVAEAQQEQPAARLEHLPQPPDVAPPVVVR